MKKKIQNPRTLKGAATSFRLIFLGINRAIYREGEKGKGKSVEIRFQQRE